MVILGEMRELGADSATEHQRIISHLATMELCEIWLVGQEFSNADCSSLGKHSTFNNVEEVRKGSPPPHYQAAQSSSREVTAHDSSNCRICCRNQKHKDKHNICIGILLILTERPVCRNKAAPFLC